MGTFGALRHDETVGESPTSAARAASVVKITIIIIIIVIINIDAIKVTKK